jgi:hypothetical protein
VLIPIFAIGIALYHAITAVYDRLELLTIVNNIMANRLPDKAKDKRGLLDDGEARETTQLVDLYTNAPVDTGIALHDTIETKQQRE